MSIEEDPDEGTFGSGCLLGIALVSESSRVDNLLNAISILVQTYSVLQ